MRQALTHTHAPPKASTAGDVRVVLTRRNGGCFGRDRMYHRGMTTHPPITHLQMNGVATDHDRPEKTRKGETI